MKVFLLALALVAVCVAGMCFNIIFRKDGKFPEYEVSKNKEMRKLGIRCVNEAEDDLIGPSGRKGEDACPGNYSDACEGCALYGKETV